MLAPTLSGLADVTPQGDRNLNFAQRLGVLDQLSVVPLARVLSEHAPPARL